MEYKILEEQDLDLMLNFVDDENAIYNTSDLKKFISESNAYGFIAKENNKIVGFAVGYVLTHPDGNKSFYFDSIDVMADYQNKGVGTSLMSYVRDYTKSIGCYEMFLVTNKSNISACKCYEKSGAISEAEDDIVYIYDFEGDK
jgi:ribosomal protein S18 acetylase RimI-like enzyme